VSRIDRRAPVFSSPVSRRLSRALALALVALGAVAGPASADLSTRQLVGQRMIYSYDGTRVPAGLVARIGRGEAAGVLLFADNVGSRAELRATLRRLQAIRRPAGLGAPLLVMIDQEGGLVKRLSGAPTYSPAALGRIGSAGLTRSQGRATAANLRDVGVNVDLAPVVDVGRPGTFQQRLQRSYSSDAQVASRMAAAFVGGLQDGGVAATLKHFPGLGTVRRNEDDVAARVPLILSTLRRIDEAPFAAGIAAGAKLVMTSTAIYPALASRPAMLAPQVTAELRGHLGFTGVSVTDDVTVRGLAPYGNPSSLGLAAARAGNDLLLYGGGYASAAASAESLIRASQSGRLPVGPSRASVARILALRASLG
jgi:beta-N-acetylhexosaminidase